MNSRLQETGTGSRKLCPNSLANWEISTRSESARDTNKSARFD